MRGGGGMGCDGFGIAQIIGNLDDLQRIAKPESRLFAAFDVKRNQCAARPHLGHCQCVLRMTGQARENHLRNAVIVFKDTCDMQRRIRHRPAAQIQRGHAVQHDPRGKRRHRTARVLHVRFSHFADKLLGAANHPAQRAALPVDMLGGGIDNNISALGHGLAEHWCRKHVVHNHQRPHGMRDFRHFGDIHQFQRRIRHGLEKHRFGGGGNGGAPCVQVSAINKSDLHAEPRQHFFQHIKARSKQRA